MTQTSNRVLDEFAKLMTDAAGVAQGVRREVETAVRGQAERFLGDMDVVQREEFEAVREMAAKARAENQALSQRLSMLEAKFGVAGAGMADASAAPMGEAGGAASAPGATDLGDAAATGRSGPETPDPAVSGS